MSKRGGISIEGVDSMSDGLTKAAQAAKYLDSSKSAKEAMELALNKEKTR